MTRDQLEHVLRASAAITTEKSFVVIGSQSVLLPFPDAPTELLLSNEVDLYPALHPERSDLIEGSIGQLSMFHDTFGYYADGVGPETATMPTDWMKYAALHYIGELTVIVPDLHDIAVSKCAAGRDKDAEWVRGLFRHQMIDPARLESRLRDVADGPIETWVAWARRRYEEARA